MRKQDNLLLAKAIAEYPGRWLRRRARDIGPVRVMGTIEGYIIARFKGAAPFIEHANNWHAAYEPVVPGPIDGGGS